MRRLVAVVRARGADAVFAEAGARRAGWAQTIIALFPKEVGEFAYADLKKARTLPWFPQLQQQDAAGSLPPIRKVSGLRGRRSEYAGGGIGLGTGGRRRDQQDCRSGIFRGADRGTNRRRGARKLQSGVDRSLFQAAEIADVQGAQLHAVCIRQRAPGANDLFFFFIDSSTAAFGHRALLEKMIEVRFGGEEGLMRNDKFFPLVNEANGSGVFWAVLNPAYTRLAMQQLAPEIQQFPEAAKLVTRMQNMIINMDASSGIDGKFQGICGSTEDANALGQLLQMGLMYKQYQSKHGESGYGATADAGQRDAERRPHRRAHDADRRPDGFADQAQYVRVQDVAVAETKCTFRRERG